MTLQNLLARLDGVRAVTNGHVARCPLPGHGKGNGDRNPSLSVSETDEKILLYCFAGCDTKDVLEQLGLKFKDLFVDDASERAVFRNRVS